MENNQALKNQVVSGCAWFAVMGMIFNRAAVIFGILSKSPGGIFLASVGFAVGACAWFSAINYRNQHPLR